MKNDFIDCLHHIVVFPFFSHVFPLAPIVSNYVFCKVLLRHLVVQITSLFSGPPSSPD